MSSSSLFSKRLSVYRGQLERLKQAQVRWRGDWPATFSCNRHSQVWPFVTFGYTPEKYRNDLVEEFPILQQIVLRLIQDRPEGGRFHINDCGVYWADNGGRAIEFEFRD